jgi:Arc/MetJ-type ribon-helix-helix transcriptional regulator
VAFIEAAVVTGRYGPASKVVRAGQWLREEIRRRHSSAGSGALRAHSRPLAAISTDLR